MPRPPKGSFLRSYDELLEFLRQERGSAQRHLGYRRVLRSWENETRITLTVGTQNVAMFDEVGVFLRNVSTFSRVPYAAETAQLVANSFGYRYGPAHFGPFKGKACLFPLTGIPLGIEADLNGIPVDTHGWKLQWNGRVFGPELDEATKERARQSYWRRSLVQLDRNDAARRLGYLAANRMANMKLPTDVSHANLYRMNEHARRLGYLNVAEAHANDVPVGATEAEQRLLDAGVGELLRSANEPPHIGTNPGQMEFCREWEETFGKDYSPLPFLGPRRMQWG